ncbi:MAG: hypothetical protein KF914_03525 [Rhizobiaceae bacterium]|nr:hypothetical protein [Rhizobiaceae bacterium]
MSTALRSDSGRLVGPGMKTGFWQRISALLLETDASLLTGEKGCNFFEKIFRPIEKSQLSYDFQWRMIFQHSESIVSVV